MKKNDILGFMKANKDAVEGVAIGTIACVIGIIGGYILCSKKSKSNEYTEYADLIREVKRFDGNTSSDGTSLNKRLTWVLEDAHATCGLFPTNEVTIRDVLSDTTLAQAEKTGAKPDEVVVGIIVATKGKT